MTQETALDILKSGASVFLTGEPGSGKTHTVNRYVAYLREHGIEPALTASTGIAATHIGGMTIHSWSGIGIANVLSARDLDRISSNEKVYRRLAKARVLIIDEVSMLDSRLLTAVDAVCKAVRRTAAPFGGLQTVLVGDFFQLPPVSRENAAQFAFRSPAWSDLAPAVCYLTEQHRQDDAGFLSVLSAIRTDSFGDDHSDVLKARISSHSDAPKDIVKLFAHNADVDRLNDNALALIKGTPNVFTMRSIGPAHLVESLQRGCLSPENLALKIGASVMFTRNDRERRFVNGTLGKIVGFDKDSTFPIVQTRAGNKITAEPVEWMIEDQGKSLASLQQVPLRLAWAMTIHKSQGMSLDAALIDLGSAFEYGQGYVALSRVRRLSGLYLLGCNERATQVHPDILAQDREFRASSEAVSEAVGRMTMGESSAAAEKFIAYCGGTTAKVEKQVKPGAEYSSKGEKEGKKFTLAELRTSHAMAYAKWTPQEEEKLVEAFKAGESTAKIAALMGRKRGGISSRLKKLGLME